MHAIRQLLPADCKKWHHFNGRMFSKLKDDPHILYMTFFSQILRGFMWTLIILSYGARKIPVQPIKICSHTHKMSVVWSASLYDCWAHFLRKHNDLGALYWHSLLIYRTHYWRRNCRGMGSKKAEQHFLHHGLQCARSPCCLQMKNFWKDYGPPTLRNYSPSDCFLWSYIKENIHWSNPHNLDKVKTNICNSIADVSTRTLQAMTTDILRRVRLCVQHGWAHFRNEFVVSVEEYSSSCNILTNVKLWSLQNKYIYICRHNNSCKNTNIGCLQ
jgi:hypothetical protein